MDVIISRIELYLESLDWAYIFTFVVIAWLLPKDTVVTSWWKDKKRKGFRHTIRKVILSVPEGWRVIVLGFLYGVFLYWLRSYDKSHIENLFQSFLFATATYTLILQHLLKLLEKKVSTMDELPNNYE